MELKCQRLFFFAICLMFVCLSSCRKEKPSCDEVKDKVVRVQFSSSLRSLVPHSGRDTLIFFNQYGDVVYLVGIGTKTTTQNKSVQAIYPGGGGAACLAYVHHFIDFKEIQYRQDTVLSNTTILFPFNTIVLNSDSANDFVNLTGFRGGVQIWSGDAIFEAYYGQFTNQYYTQRIDIQNKVYMCMSFNVKTANKYKSKLYFNHHQGIIQVRENDTIVWNRKLN